MGIYGRPIPGKEKRRRVQLLDDRGTENNGPGSEVAAIVDRGVERSLDREPDRSMLASHGDAAAVPCEGAGQGPPQ